MSIINEIYNESPTKRKSRQNIIETAFKLFSENGIEPVNLSLIAKESNNTIRNLYRYYASKEALVTDVAYQYISIFNSIHKIRVDSNLNGFEQLEDVLQKQIENELISDNSDKIMTFISYFDIYMTRANITHEAIRNYVEVYAPKIKLNVLESTRQALLNGVKDQTINISLEEVDYYLGYIFHSLMSIISRVSLKRYESDIRQYDYIQKHIDIILSHLEK